MQTQTETLVTPGGVDTVHCSFYCKFTPKFLDHLHEIAEAKRIAEHPPKNSGAEDAPEPVFVCNDRVYVVMPYGFSPNKGQSRYCYYQFVLKDGGITIGLQPREHSGNTVGEEDDKDKNKCPNVRVEIGAMPLIIAGSMETLMLEVEERLKEMGLIVVKNRLGRVDVCADLPFSVQSLQHAIIDRRYISRARSWSMYCEFDHDGWDKAEIIASEFDDENGMIALHGKGYACTGFSIGKDKIMCRGYDKLEKEKHCEEMLLALSQRRFGGELPEDVTRIEFQLRRDALRGITVAGRKDSIRTWQDFIECQSAIVRYLCTEWLVFTEKKFSRSHTDEIKKCMDAWHPDWLKAVSAFKRAFGSSEQKIVRLNGSIKREAQEHIAQSLGCGQSAILKSDLILSPYDPLWKEKVAAFQFASTMRYLSDPKKEKSFWQNWNDKELRQEASLPEESFIDITGVGSRGAGVTHHSPLLDDIRALLTSAGASGPAPAFIS
jgi:hypothetical protein